MIHLDLFSGIGGFALAAQWVGGIETLAFCEIDPFCQKVLQKNFPNVPIFTNIKYLRIQNYAKIDIITGGFPCQPFSVAGKQRGEKDDRYLWPEMLRIITETRPTWAIIENVTGFIRLGLDKALLDLESEGYESIPFVIPACGVNANHKRDRVWVIAYYKASNVDRGFTESKINWKSFGTVFVPELWGTKESLLPPSCLCRTDDGIPDRVDRTKALGNAIVPQVAYQIMKHLIKQPY